MNRTEFRAAYSKHRAILKFGQARSNEFGGLWFVNGEPRRPCVMGDKTDCERTFHSVINAAGDGTIHRTAAAHRNVLAYMRSRRKHTGCRLPA